MANENDLNGKVGLDVTDFKAAVTSLNREIRVIESGFKAVAAGMDDWRTTSTGLEAKISSLNKITELQRQKISNLADQYLQVVEAQGKDSRAAQDLEIKINKETAALNKNKLELENCKNSLVDLKENSEEAGRSVKKLADEEEKAEKKTSSFKDSLKNLGKHLGSGIAGAAKITAASMVALGAAAAGAAVGIFKLSEKASDLGEAQNVVESTFKKTGKEIEKWTDTMANSAGISKTMATQFVGSMGAMLKSSGLSEKAAGDMSKALVQLTGDMSSFYNLDTETAWEKIRSGIAGETEPLKALGINMSVANLEAFALSQGIKKAYKEMNQAEQTTLRYNYLMKVTADAQGDFAKTLGDSFANQTRVAKMNIETLGMSIGSIFLPAILNMTKGLNESFAQINKLLGDGFQNSDLGQLSNIIGGMLQKAVQGLATFIPQAIPVIVSVLNTLVATIIQILPTLLPPLLQGVMQLFNGLISLIQQNTQPLVSLATNLIVQFATFILQALPQLLIASVEIIIALVNGISGALPQLIPVAVQAILTLVQGLANNLPQLIDMAINLVLALVQGLINALPLLLQQAPKIINTIVTGLVNALPRLVDAAIKIINALVDFITNNLDLIISAAIQIIVALAVGLIKALPQLSKVVPQIVSAITNKLLNTNWIDVGINIVKGIANGLIGGLGYISEAAQRVAKNALNSIKGALKIQSPSRVMRDQVGQFIPAGIALGISDNAKQVDAAMSGLSSKLTGNFATSLSVNTNQANSNDNGAILKTLGGLVEALKNYTPVLSLDGERVAVATGPYDNKIQGNYTKIAGRSEGM